MQYTTVRRLINCIVILVVAICFCVGCDSNQRELPTDAAGNVIDVAMPAEKAKEQIVFTMGDSCVCLDEVRYYLYNTQATYEAFYAAENKTLDWNSAMSKSDIAENVTLAEAVKSTVYNSICERECFAKYALEHGILLTDEEMEEVRQKQQNFHKQSGEKILERISVEEERLVEIYAKDALAKKVMEYIDNQLGDNSQDVYKKWKNENNITANLYWSELNFNTPIFGE